MNQRSSPACRFSQRDETSMNAYQLTFSDMWMLQAMHVSDFTGQACELEKIIGIADGLGHAIPTFAEFNNAIYHLKQAGLLAQSGGVLALTESANILLEKFAALPHPRQREAIRLQLRIDLLKDHDPDVLMAPEVFMPENVYRDAVQAHTRRFMQRYAH
jgi:hypothetical protein